MSGGFLFDYHGWITARETAVDDDDVRLGQHESHEVDGLEPLWIVDDTVIPVRDRKVGASARNYRCSAHMQVIIDTDTHL